jgi:hypothetical protein
MPKKSSAKQPAAELRGVIDRFEGELAAIVFDDEQKIDCPRRYLPKDAQAGDAIIARIVEPDDQLWSGEWQTSGAIKLSGGQSIHWPGSSGTGQIALAIEIDHADTAARKERVRKLVDDIFKKQ